MQTVHASTFQMTNQLIMLHQQQQQQNKQTKKQNIKAHKNETLECHGQDQQTVIDEILLKKKKKKRINHCCF